VVGVVSVLGDNSIVARVGTGDSRPAAAAEVKRAYGLWEAEDLEGALAVLGGVVARFGDAGDVAVRRQVALALWEQARLYRVLGMAEQRMAAFAQLTERFADSTDPDTANLVTRAFYLHGHDRDQAGDGVGAEALYDESLRRARGATRLLVRDAARSAAIGKALLLSARGLNWEAVGLLDEQIAESADLIAEHPLWLADLLTAKLQILEIGYEDVQALEVADDIIERFGESPDHDLRMQVARALMYKMISLARADPQADREPLFELLATRFADEALEALDKWIPAYRSADGVRWLRALTLALALRAGILLRIGHEDEAASAYNAMIEELADETDELVTTIVAMVRDLLADA
jgi:tetratricopeptide (TPR) repeat protein